MKKSFTTLSFCIILLSFLGSCKKDNVLPTTSSIPITGTSVPPIVYSIHYVNLGSGQTVTYPNTLYFDLNGDGSNDISFTVLHQNKYYCSDILHDVNVEIIPTNISVGLAPDSTNNSGKRIEILLNTRIDSAMNWSNKLGISDYSYALLNGINDNTPVCSRYSLFPSNGTGYIGIKIIIGVNLYYGWMHVTSTYSSGTLLEFAMNNTPNQALQAGQTH